MKIEIPDSVSIHLAVPAIQKLAKEIGCRVYYDIEAKTIKMVPAVKDNVVSIHTGGKRG